MVELDAAGETGLEEELAETKGIAVLISLLSIASSRIFVSVELHTLELNYPPPQ